MPLLSNQASSVETEIRNLNSPSMTGYSLQQSVKFDMTTSGYGPHMHVALNRTNRTHIVRETVLLSFCDSVQEEGFQLPNLSEKEWNGLLRWMDLSGLALYFLDRIMELHLSDLLPAKVLARLKQNLQDNIERTQGMITEFVALQREFQKADLSYATLKGFSLCPHSVPRPELRHQFDLDFLVAERSAAGARKILERQGYRLYAMSGRSWEFKRDEAPAHIRDLYKNLPCRCVELHLEPEGEEYCSMLERVYLQGFHGIWMPVLSPVDLFIGQGLHAYKHICSEFSRASHLLEFRRHVLSRRGDDGFWKEVQSKAGENVRACIGLGVVTLLISSVMGDFAPEAFTNWTVGRLPKTVHHWVDLYGRRAIFGDPPGSKLYLLLQRELQSAGVQQKRSLRKALLPSHFPPPVVRGIKGETLCVRMSRYRLQISFVLFRLRFHVVEGLRYFRESFRWRQQIDRVIR